MEASVFICGYRDGGQGCTVLYVFYCSIQDHTFLIFLWVLIVVYVLIYIIVQLAFFILQLINNLPLGYFMDSHLVGVS
jgi:hypothetical protein